MNTASNLTLDLRRIVVLKGASISDHEATLSLTIGDLTIITDRKGATVDGQQVITQPACPLTHLQCVLSGMQRVAAQSVAAA